MSSQNYLLYKVNITSHRTPRTNHGHHCPYFSSSSFFSSNSQNPLLRLLSIHLSTSLCEIPGSPEGMTGKPVIMLASSSVLYLSFTKCRLNARLCNAPVRNQLSSLPKLQRFFNGDGYLTALGEDRFYCLGLWVLLSLC